MTDLLTHRRALAVGAITGFGISLSIRWGTYWWLMHTYNRNGQHRGEQ